MAELGNLICILFCCLGGESFNLSFFAKLSPGDDLGIFGRAPSGLMLSLVQIFFWIISGQAQGGRCGFLFYNILYIWHRGSLFFNVLV